MEKTSSEAQFFGKEKIWKILFRIAPPVMLAQLIQALYNIVDSLFVGRYAETGLTALSIIYPIQLLMVALAVGTGVGINTAMSAQFGLGKGKNAQEFAGVGTPLAGLLWALFAALTWLILPSYARLSSPSPKVVEEVVTYGRIVSLFSFGLFFESVWTKILQSEGDMRTPMLNHSHPSPVIQPSHPGVILTIAREHGSSGKEIGRWSRNGWAFPSATRR